MLIKHRIEIDQILESSKEIFDSIKNYPDGVDEIWLFLERQHSVKRLKQQLEIAKDFADKVRALGIKLSVEVAPLGHGDKEGFDTDCKDYRVDSFGKTYEGQYCFRSKEYLKEKSYALSLIAKELKPYTFYFDDDMRIRNWRSGIFCLCDTCVKEFNDKYKTAYGREDLIEKIENDIEFRKKYVEFSYEGIAEFCYAVTKEIIAVSPETHMGLEHGDYAGEGFLYCIEAMYKASGKTVRSRSGAGSYNDYNPADLVKKTFQTGYQLSKLPDYVDEYCNEIENYPSTYFGKTVYGTCFEASIHLASGFNCTSIKNWRGSFSEDEGEEIFDDCLRECAKRRKYWEDLVSDNNRGGRKGGIRVFVPKNYWDKKSDYLIVPSFYGWEYNHYGIPVTFSETKNECYYFDEIFADVVSKEELVGLFSHSVVISGAAIYELQKNGFKDVLEEYLGVSAVKSEKPCEKFTDHPVNGEYAGKKWGKYLFEMCASKTYGIICNNDKAEILGKSDDNSTVFSAIVPTKFGAKWFIQGFRSGDSLYPFMKRQQINNAIREITGGLSAEYVSRNRVMLIPIEDKDGKVLNVSLVNQTIEKQGNVVLKVKNAAKNKAVLTDEFGNSTPLETKESGGILTVIIPEVSPWSIKTVFFK